MLGFIVYFFRGQAVLFLTRRDLLTVDNVSSPAHLRVEPGFELSASSTRSFFFFSLLSCCPQFFFSLELTMPDAPGFFRIPAGRGPAPFVEVLSPFFRSPRPSVLFFLDGSRLCPSLGEKEIMTRRPNGSLVCWASFFFFFGGWGIGAISSRVVIDE